MVLFLFEAYHERVIVCIYRFDVYQSHKLKQISETPITRKMVTEANGLVHFHLTVLNCTSTYLEGKLMCACHYFLTPS